MKFHAGRRGALVSFGAGLLASGLAQNGSLNAATQAALAPAAAEKLRELSRLLAGMPRRRDFKAVPMILDNPDQWDAAPLAAVLAYTGGPKQAWDNTDLLGAWLNGMRNSINALIWSFGEPNFLCVSATHGSAHLALFDQDMWDKYQLAKVVGGNVSRNMFIGRLPSLPHGPADFQSAEGGFSSSDNGILVLQQRGAVFMACHNSIWELAERLVRGHQNPDHQAVETIAAELTNHLIADVVLTPGAVATLVKLQQSGSPIRGKRERSDLPGHRSEIIYRVSYQRITSFSQPVTQP